MIPILPAHRVITMPAGNTRLLELSTTYSGTWSDEDKQGDPIEADDVDEATFLLKSSLSDADDSAEVEKTLGDGIEVTDGKITVTLDSEDTSDLEGVYYGTLRLNLDGAVLDWQDLTFDGVPFVELRIIQGAVEAVD